MTRRWKITWQAFGLQMLVGLLVIGGGFIGAVSEQFIFEKYLLIYAPLMFLVQGAGFLAVFFFLPIVILLYSYLIGGIISKLLPADAR